MTAPLIYVAGHRGMVGSAIVRALQAQGHPAAPGLGAQPQQGGYAPKPAAPAYQAPAAPAQRPAPQPQQNFTPDLDDGWDDDIPF